MRPLDRRDAEFTAFVHEHGGALLRAAHFLTGDRWQAGDLLQSALTKTYLAWPVARSGSPRAYARRILVNCHTDIWRRRRWRESTHAPEDLPTRAGGRSRTHAEGDPADVVADRSVVTQALARLTPRERAVVVLRYLEDLSEKETARQLGIRVGTVKSLNARALAKLRTSPVGGLPRAGQPRETADRPTRTRLDVFVGRGADPSNQHPAPFRKDTRHVDR